MSPEERELLEKSVSLSEENNKMLHAMRRSMRWASIIRGIYWVFIIGSAIGAYYFIQPYLDQIMSAYGGAKSNFDSFSDMIKNFQR